MRAILLLFGSLNDQDMRWLAARGRPRDLPDGAPLIAAGTRPEELLLLLDGRAAVSDAAGRQLALRREGDLLGEMSFVEARPASAAVRAAGPLRLLALPQAVVAARLAADDGFSARFHRGLAVLLATRLREAMAGAPAEEEEVDPLVLEGLTRAGERFALLRALVDEAAR
ncbi:cyclic nucleotide-binding domain-containing protein [Roseomonas sp. 18066]|uniref:cyclic nucleotide-binding domain-containing protein n=1 Tax=Roseomonas sp. 18066 TaxID=2681412 RepID=UPI0013586F8D|nr:cyclic nucleotide-binding domain-containing protein [Roseomonas sp. 18066]